MRQSSVYFRNDHHLAATHWLPEVEIHSISQLAQRLYYVTRQLILRRYASKYRNALIDIYNVLLVAIGVSDFICIYVICIYNSKILWKYRISHKVTNLASLHWSCPSISGGSNSDKPRSKRTLRWKMSLHLYVSLTNLPEVEIYFTEDFSHKSRLTTIWYHTTYYSIHKNIPFRFRT